MDRQETMPPLLARIPDLRAPERKDGRKSPSIGVRIFGYTGAFKVLAVAALLLISVAIVPFMGKKGPAPHSAPTPDTLAIGQPAPPAPTADIAPAWLTPVATPEPAASSASSPPAPSILPQPEIANTLPAPTDAPLMSSWPNPAHPISVTDADGAEPRTGVNQPMAIRPSEYIRSSYDCTRPSLH